MPHFAVARLIACARRTHAAVSLLGALALALAVLAPTALATGGGHKDSGSAAYPAAGKTNAKAKTPKAHAKDDRKKAKNGAAKDERHPVKDKQKDRPAKDRQKDQPAKDDQKDQPAKDEPADRPARDKDHADKHKADDKPDHRPDDDEQPAGQPGAVCENSGHGSAEDRNAACAPQPVCPPANGNGDYAEVAYSHRTGKVKGARDGAGTKYAGGNADHGAGKPADAKHNGNGNDRGDEADCVEPQPQPVCGVPGKPACAPDDQPVCGVPGKPACAPDDQPVCGVPGKPACAPDNQPVPGTTVTPITTVTTTTTATPAVTATPAPAAGAAPVTAQRTPAATTTTTPQVTNVVAGTQVRSGRATLRGPSRCSSTRFSVTVSGRNVRRVTFFVGGRQVRTVTMAGGRRSMTVALPVRLFGARRQAVRARVTFRNGAAPRTLTTTATRCAQGAVSPQFTG
ncbi:MAG: hypothetical protein QOJ21_1008 [Solirubrobacteraceae bacterium]|nr:hypothetical protein [Solirubrobacteraceae bacterium]